MLYTTQFHPEIARFYPEGTMDDGGVGQRWIAAFLGEAGKWWAGSGA